MSDNFHESYQDEHPDMPTERSTGFVFAVVATIVALILFYVNDYAITTGVVISLTVAAIFAILAQFASQLLRPLNILWFKFSLLLFKIVNPVIMFILYATVIVLPGLLMQLIRDPLKAKKDPSAKTYWIEKDPDSSTRSMKNQF